MSTSTVMHDRLDISTLLGNTYDVNHLSGDILKLYNMEFEVFLRKKAIMFIVDKRDMMKKVYKDAKLGYEMIVKS